MVKIKQHTPDYKVILQSICYVPATWDGDDDFEDDFPFLGDDDAEDAAAAPGSACWPLSLGSSTGDGVPDWDDPTSLLSLTTSLDSISMSCGCDTRCNTSND